MKKFVQMSLIALAALFLVVSVSFALSSNFVNNDLQTVDFEDSGEPEFVKIDFEDSGEPEFVKIDFEDSGEPEFVKIDFEDSGEPEFVKI